MLPKLHVGMGTAVGFHEAAAGPSDTQSRLCDGSRITSNPRDMRGFSPPLTHSLEEPSDPPLHRAHRGLVPGP